MKNYRVKMVVNGTEVEVSVRPDETLLQVLRDRVGRTDVKMGCGKGDCGACAVMLDGVAVNSCLTLTLQAHGKEVVTLNGFGTEERPHPLQESFVRHGAIQCGFCTSGMIVAAKALLDRNPKPSREEIRAAISGNLCRCTGYKKIIDAVQDAAFADKP
ncbi:MAG: 2Fe-2S iron-sulfur cluster binding domain-containing protein [Proteobacteria bacterium]|nr:2Fe-2S iron-sulfur cluster binding domain-containing protein [Pseudomonadota bacterium]